MLNENIPIETIMKITKLTKEELLEIKNNNKQNNIYIKRNK